MDDEMLQKVVTELVRIYNAGVSEHDASDLGAMALDLLHDIGYKAEQDPDAREGIVMAVKR